MSVLRSIGLSAVVLALSGGVVVATWSYISARRKAAAKEEESAHPSVSAVHDGHQRAEQELVTSYTGQGDETIQSDARGETRAEHQETPVVQEKNRAGYQDISVAQEENRAGHQEHPVAREENRAGHQETPVVHEENRAGHQNHSVAQEENRAGHQETPVVQEKNRAGYQDISVAQEENRAGHQDHFVAQEENREGYQDLSLTQEDHGMGYQEHTAAQKEHGRGYQEHHASQEAHRSGYKEHPVAQEEHRTGYQDHSVAQEEHRTGYQDHPVVHEQKNLFDSSLLPEEHRGVQPNLSFLQSDKVVDAHISTMQNEGKSKNAEPIETPVQKEMCSINTSSEIQIGEKTYLCKRVLVLGLDGSGKTSVLNSIAASKGRYITSPTEGVNAMCINSGNSKMEFLEIGGSEQLRPYWKMYLSRAFAIIFVVDSADHSRLPLAKRHLHQLIQQDSVLPLIVLANKQDLQNAHHVTDIHDALALSEICENRKLFLIGTHVTEDNSEVSSGIQDMKQYLAQLHSECSKMW